ncbi:transcription elongation regulator 1-like protein [Stegostoma tigrinum]|uniref:transcription elongation regulator 1-like protein n=1 Tax=Stegostoma tigrinum TaxID=3053191 RepID=UPI0028709E92|nr:transcription elongation regulator 1-like protein [Stegostoma tigrinum]XP_059509085.1 transcription elongation regulator 1-like protein [Stegostoma tigrinum]
MFLKGNTLGLWDVRCRMLPIPHSKGQHQIWQMNGEPPPWIWTSPTVPGLFRIIAPPQLLPLASPLNPPEFLQSPLGWQVPYDSFIPLMVMPSPPEQAVLQLQHPNTQWDGIMHPSVLGFPPPVDFIPVVPHMYTAWRPSSKGWEEKWKPDCKVYFNNAIAVESTWGKSEEVNFFQGHKIPVLKANQVAVALSTVNKPTTPTGSKPLLVVTPQSITGDCESTFKWVTNNQAVVLATAAAAAAAMVTVETEKNQDLPPANTQPYLLTLSPIKIPFVTTHLPTTSSSYPSTRFLKQIYCLQRDSSKHKCGQPAICDNRSIAQFEGRNLNNGKEKEPYEQSCTKSEGKTESDENGEEKTSKKAAGEEGKVRHQAKPVASTPVPGSPWCVVWTGDDRVFFFNPSIQLSVWEKPVELEGRGDINKIIQDPPHKRKIELATSKDETSNQEEANEEHLMKTKRNKTEQSEIANSAKEEMNRKSLENTPHRTIAPLEERINRFRDMLLERGVSAFSTWEKELHKIVFDPRYLLLNPEERKQIFEQFIKARIKEEYKEKKSKLLQAKEEFRKLLEESKLTPRSTFQEFAEKYGRDHRFRLVQKRKDQEHFFNQFINILKKRDKENRVRLRKIR